MTETASSVKSILSRDVTGTGELRFSNYSVDSSGVPNAGIAKIIMVHNSTSSSRIIKLQLDGTDKFTVNQSVIALPIYTTNGTLKTISSNGTVSVDTSDKRLKKDIVNNEYSLSQVNAIQPIKFKWKRNSEGSVGFLADEIMNIIPESVDAKKYEYEYEIEDRLDDFGRPIIKFKEDGITPIWKLDRNGEKIPRYKAIQVLPLLSTLWNAVKELSIKNTLLEDRINRLEKI